MVAETYGGGAANGSFSGGVGDGEWAVGWSSRWSVSSTRGRTWAAKIVHWFFLFTQMSAHGKESGLSVARSKKRETDQGDLQCQ